MRGMEEIYSFVVFCYIDKKKTFEIPCGENEVALFSFSLSLSLKGVNEEHLDV